MHFGVRLTRFLMPAFADDALALHDDAAHARIGMTGVQPALRQFDRALHHPGVEGSEHGAEV